MAETSPWFEILKTLLTVGGSVVVAWLAFRWKSTDDANALQKRIRHEHVNEIRKAYAAYAEAHYAFADSLGLYQAALATVRNMVRDGTNKSGDELNRMAKEPIPTVMENLKKLYHTYASVKLIDSYKLWEPNLKISHVRMVACLTLLTDAFDNFGIVPDFAIMEVVSNHFRFAMENLPRQLELIDKENYILVVKQPDILKETDRAWEDLAAVLRHGPGVISPNVQNAQRGSADSFYSIHWAMPEQ